MSDQKLEVRPAAAEEWDEAMQLVLRTFTEFDAPDYSREGIANFHRFVADAEAIYSYEGTKEINSLIVGRSITGMSAFV